MSDDDAQRSDGLVGSVGRPKNGRPPRLIELRIQFDPDSGATQLEVRPPHMITNRFVMYGLLEMVRDIVYRQQLPGELAILEHAQKVGPRIVVADGPLPPLPRS